MGKYNEGEPKRRTVKGPGGRNVSPRLGASVPELGDPQIGTKPIRQSKREKRNKYADESGSSNN